MNTMKMYGSICEWDIGLGGYIYEDLEVLKKEQKQALINCGVDDPFEELVAEGLVGFEEIEVTLSKTRNAAGTLEALRVANAVRQENWPGAAAASDPLFRAVEFGGEAGELLDAVKKLTRAVRGIAGNKGQSVEYLRQAVMEEMGDVIISLDMLATDLGIPLADCVPMKFNKTSRKVGVPVEMNPETWAVEFAPQGEPDLFTR